MRKIAVLALGFGLGLAVTDLLALAVERILTTAPMHELLMAGNSRASNAAVRLNLVANMPREP